MARILAARNGRVQNSPPMIKRCWVGGDDPLMLAYHDEEWGVPVRDDRALFGKLILDGFQAGLSWRVDRKSTRLNSSHGYISYAVFCLKKKNEIVRSEPVAI